MKASEARDEIFGVVKTAWVTDASLAVGNIKWPNVRHTSFPPQGAPSAEVNLRHLMSSQTTLPSGNSGKIKYKSTALLEVVVRVDPDDSSDDIYTIAEAFIDKLRKASTNGIHYRDPTLRELPAEGNFARVAIICMCDYYHVDQPTVAGGSQDTVFLFHAGAFVDSSIYGTQSPHSIGGVNGASIDTVTTDFFGGTQGILALDGVDQGAFSPASVDYAFRDKPFTIEFAMRQTAVAGGPFALLASGGPGPVDFPGWKIAQLDANTLLVEYELEFYQTFAFTPSLNTWYHVLMSRDSSDDLRVFIDGVQAGSTVSMPMDIVNQSGLQIGYHLSDSEYAPVQFDEIRIKKGTALHVAPFTPPVVQYSATD